MKLESLLKAVLGILCVALIVVIGSWVTSELSYARAQGGGGSASGEWILVTGQYPAGGDNVSHVLYMFNTDKQVLLVYAYHRGRKTGVARNAYSADLEFLAGRHCRWDVLYSQLAPYPYGPDDKPPSGVHMPAQMKSAFERLSTEPSRP